jgi:acyl carrier protein
MSRHEVAEALCEQAASLLAEPDIAVSDNFLDVGGHSLMALDLSKEMEQRFGVPLDIRVLFEESFETVAQDIATRVAATRATP